MAANATTTARRTTAPAKKATTKATTPVPEQRTEKVETVEAQAQPQADTEFEYAYLMDKEPTQLHRNYQAWLRETTGVELDLKTIQVVCVTRNAFQKSEANQKDLSTRQEAWKKAQAEKAKKQEAAKKAKLAELAKELGVKVV